MKSLLFVLFAFTAFSCQPAEENKEVAEENPPMEDFNLVGSDEKAMEIADSVMKHMGGRKNWDETRYLSWTFFGRRKLLWDKWNGDVRIEFIGDPNTVYLVNIKTMEGKVKKAGEEITHPDSLAKELKRAEAIWINDSYWLCMPFKLKDSGVTLKYLREDTTMAGKDADVLGLTFQNVGILLIINMNYGSQKKMVLLCNGHISEKRVRTAHLLSGHLIITSFMGTSCFLEIGRMAAGQATWK